MEEEKLANDRSVILLPSLRHRYIILIIHLHIAEV